MREFKGENAYFIQEEGITYISILIYHIDLKIAKEIVQQRLTFTGDEDALIFVDNFNVKSISKSAREYFGSDESNQKLKAIAVYGKSVLSVFLANFIINISLSHFTIPIKVFTNREKGVKWLKSLK